MTQETPSARPDRENMPYRHNAGVVVFNRAGLVFMGQRIDLGDTPTAWQFPQGGIDKGEEPIDAAIRELYEETSIQSISLLTAMPDWVAYDLPDDMLGTALKGKYRGQKQMWYAALFEGEDDEIDIAHPGGGHRPEFRDWKWAPLADAPQLVVPFKREVYQKIVNAFSRVPAQIAAL